MSTVFIAAQADPFRPGPLHWTLLAISIILCGAWLINTIKKGGPLRTAAKIHDRPGLIELTQTILGLLLLNLLLYPLFKGLLGSKTLEIALAGAVASILTCTLVLARLARANPICFKGLGLESAQLLRQLAPGFITALAVWPIAVMLLMPASLYVIEFVTNWGWGLTYTPQAHNLLREFNESLVPLNLSLTIAIAVIIAPLTEEVIFRALLQGTLFRLYRSRWLAIVVSAAIFALLHLAIRGNVPAGEFSLAQMETIVPLFFLGLVLGYAYEKSRSLYRPICIHMGFNALSLLILWLESA